MKTLRSVSVAVFVLIAGSDQLAARPGTFFYQGILTDVAGKRRVDGDYRFTFRPCEVAVGSVAIWTEQNSC